MHRREITLLLKLEHPNVVKLENVILEPERLSLIFELLDRYFALPFRFMAIPFNL